MNDRLKDDAMNRRDDPGKRRGMWEFGAKWFPETVTGCYLLCSIVWLFVGTALAKQSWEVVLEDSVYHAVVGVVLYVLLRRGVGALQANETALRESEDRLARILETNASGIVVCDEHGRITFANRAAEGILGVERGAMVGMRNDDPAWEFTDPGGAALRWEDGPVGRVHATRMPVHDFQIGVRRRDGARVFLTVNAAPLLDASGKMAGIVASFADITETKKAGDLKLRSMQEKFRNLVESVSDWVWEVDRNGVYTYVSPRVRDLLGYEPEEVLGRTPFDLMPAFEARRVAQIFGPILARREPFLGLENINRHRNGRYVVIETSAVPFFGEDGTFLGYRGVDRDIGERKRAEEMLRSSEERFRQLFEQNEEPLFLFRGGSAEILDVNPAAEKLYGQTRDDILRCGPSLFVPEGELQGFAEAVASIRPGFGLSLDRVDHVHQDGTRMIVSVRGKSVHLESGHVSYCSFRDITARVRMEEEARLQQALLIQANRMASLGTIVSGVAHEVNNPNNLIMFNAPMILAAWEDARPVLEARFREEGDFPLGGLPYSEMREVVPRLARGISDASSRIKAIVANLKDFARQDNSRGHAPVDVNDVVRAAVAIMNHEILKATHRFETSFAGDLPLVPASAQGLEQVVINLLNNAIQALPTSRHGLRVITRANTATGEVEVEVADEGTGMSPEVLGRIAEPFFSTRLDSGGLGLGLSISRSILKEHGGSLSFESEAGKGTRAIVRLPVAGRPAEAGPAKAGPVASVGG